MKDHTGYGRKAGKEEGCKEEGKRKIKKKGRGIVKEEKNLLLPLLPSTILDTGPKQGCPSEPQKAQHSPRNAHAH